MGYEEAFQTIESRFFTQWGDTTAIVADNVETSPPASTYVEFQIHTGDSFQAALGERFYRHVGIVSINIFLPKGGGTRPGVKLADQAAEIYRGQSFSGITFRAPKVTRVGEVNGRFVYNVSIPFFRDEVF
jgi:hypothetical protein